MPISTFAWVKRPAIQLLDIKILLPKSLQHLLHPKPSLMVKRKPDESGFLRLDDLLAFDWQVALGDTLLSPAEFSKLMKHASGLFRFKENYIYVSEADMMKLHKVFTQEKPMNAYQLLQTALSGEYEGAPVKLTDEAQNIKNHETAQTKAVKNIPAEIRIAMSGTPVENQATDRAYRIGQKKNVMVHRFITKNSFEEKIDEMISKKKKLAEMTVSTGENWIGKLNNRELREIFEV